MEKHIDEIQEIELFNGISKDEIIHMLPCLNPILMKYDKGQYVKMAGDKIDSFGVILEGEITISKENEAGNSTILAHLKKMEMFGEIIAFSMAEEWSVSIRAVKNTVVLFLPRERLISQCGHVCKFHKQLIQNMLSILSKKAMKLNKKVEYISLKSISSKLAKYILEQYGVTGKKTFTIPLNRNQLADFLNVSRPSMSRELGKMRDEKIIDFHLSTIRVLDEERLKEMIVKK